MSIRNISITCFSFFIIASSLLFAQDSTDSDIKWDWEWELDELEGWIMTGNKMPTISINYNIADISHKNITGDFKKAGSVEIKLGHTTRRASMRSSGIIKLNYRYLFINLTSTDLAVTKSENNKVDTRSWQFGFGRTTGLGYKLGSAAIIPYFTYTHNWTRVDFTNVEINSMDRKITDRFDESFRFGTSNEAGFKIMLGELLSLDAGYERSIIFERHLFWKWAGSALIEVASHAALDAFIYEIFDSSPAAVPVVFLLLKSALGYGLYELRQEKMNWPFSSAPPLSFDIFKFGVTFTF